MKYAATFSTPPPPRPPDLFILKLTRDELSFIYGNLVRGDYGEHPISRAIANLLNAGAAIEGDTIK